MTRVRAGVFDHVYGEVVAGRGDVYDAVDGVVDVSRGCRHGGFGFASLVFPRHTFLPICLRNRVGRGAHTSFSDNLRDDLTDGRGIDMVGVGLTGEVTGAGEEFLLDIFSPVERAWWERWRGSWTRRL